MGASLAMIHRHYGHLAREGREHAVALLDADARDAAASTSGGRRDKDLSQFADSVRALGPRPVKWCTRLSASSLVRYAAAAIAVTSSGSSAGAASAFAIESALM